MSVRRRRWHGPDGEKQAWVVDYADEHGQRQHKTFARKRDADAYHLTVTGKPASNRIHPRLRSRNVGRSPVLDDLLRGAHEIAEYAGETTNAIYHIVKTKKPPLADVIEKYGKELVSSKPRIDRALREQLMRDHFTRERKETLGGHRCRTGAR